MTTTDTPGVEFDPSSEAAQQCPYPFYEQMRHEAPVFAIDGAVIGRAGETVYAVTRHEDVCRVAREWRTFSSRFGSPAAKPSPELAKRLRAVTAEGWPNVSTMLTEDPPSHWRYRGLVSRAFTPRRVRDLEPEIRAICVDLVNGFAQSPRVDFMSGFAVPLPVRAVAAVLGVPDTRQDDFKRWADMSVAAIGRAISDDERVEAERAIVEQQHWFAGEIERRREDPQDDFLTALLHAELPPEETEDLGESVEALPARLEMAEMLSIIRQIQVAGSETTTSLMADLMVQFARHPDQWRRLRDEPDRIPAVVEEALRWASPNQGLFRIATTDTEIAGTPIPAGATVWVLFGSANHDETVFADPEEFDPDRSELHSHVAFGKGIHHCLGAALARLEAQIAVETLVEAIDTVAVVDEASLRYAPSFLLRGLTSLELDLTYR